LKHLQFIDTNSSFTMENPENTSYLYFPLASETGLKSAVTPNLGGDAKLNQDSFLLEPVSAENLHNNRSVRNFWCAVFSAAQDKSRLTAGFMWHIMERTSETFQITSTVTSFIPYNNNVEIMHVAIRNQSEACRGITAYSAIPIYGRSADNLRDHRHVTSLLHRIEVTENSILVCPAMSFDERGHQRNYRTYYVAGCTGSGAAPVSFYPTVEDFIGEGGSYTHPRSIYEHREGCPAFSRFDGKEAMGAFRFDTITLSPGESAEYIVLLGAEDEREKIFDILHKYDTSSKVHRILVKESECRIPYGKYGF